MKPIINNNLMEAKNLTFSAEGKISDVAVVNDIRFTYETDADGKRTDKIIAVRYDCTDPSTFASFTLKVNGAKAVMTPEQLEEAEDIVYIDIPVKETYIKPFSIEYGMAKVSIVGPYVRLHKN